MTMVNRKYTKNSRYVINDDDNETAYTKRITICDSVNRKQNIYGCIAEIIRTQFRKLLQMLNKRV